MLVRHGARKFEKALVVKWNYTVENNGKFPFGTFGNDNDTTPKSSHANGPWEGGCATMCFAPTPTPTPSLHCLLLRVIGPLPILYRAVHRVLGGPPMLQWGLWIPSHSLFCTLSDPAHLDPFAKQHLPPVHLRRGREGGKGLDPKTTQDVKCKGIQGPQKQ